MTNAPLTLFSAEYSFFHMRKPPLSPPIYRKNQKKSEKVYMLRAV